MTDSEPLDLTQYQDIHGIEATNVLAARDFYTVGDPYDRTEPQTRGRRSASTTAKPMGSFLRTHVTSTAFSLTSSRDELSADSRRVTGAADRADTAAHQ